VKLFLGLCRFYRARLSGATGIEYALIAAGIALGLVSIIFLFGDGMVQLFTTMGNKLLTINGS
jgi:Flp pilus assembly pilin Flp